MSDNPYEPPSSPIADERALALEGTGRFDLGQCLADAWDDTWKNFPLWLGVSVVGLAVSVLSILTVIGVFVLPVLTWGLGYFYLNMTDQRASFGDLFAGFSTYGTVLVNMLVLIVCYYGLSLIGQSVQLVGQWIGLFELTLIGLVVNIVWALAVMVRFYFAILLMIDRRTGPIESLRLSWEITRGQTPQLIGLMLAMVVVMALGLLAFLIGVIPATAMSYLMWTSAYRQVVGRPEPDSG